MEVEEFPQVCAGVGSRMSPSSETFFLLWKKNVSSPLFFPLNLKITIYSSKQNGQPNIANGIIPGKAVPFFTAERNLGKQFKKPMRNNHQFSATAAWSQGGICGVSVGLAELNPPLRGAAPLLRAMLLQSNFRQVRIQLKCRL